MERLDPVHPQSSVCAHSRTALYYNVSSPNHGTNYVSSPARESLKPSDASKGGSAETTATVRLLGQTLRKDYDNNPRQVSVSLDAVPKLCHLLHTHKHTPCAPVNNNRLLNSTSDSANSPSPLCLDFHLSVSTVFHERQSRNRYTSLSATNNL